MHISYKIELTNTRKVGGIVSASFVEIDSLQAAFHLYSYSSPGGSLERRSLEYINGVCKTFEDWAESLKKQPLYSRARQLCFRNMNELMGSPEEVLLTYTAAGSIGEELSIIRHESCFAGKEYCGQLIG